MSEGSTVDLVVFWMLNPVYGTSISFLAGEDVSTWYYEDRRSEISGSLGLDSLACCFLVHSLHAIAVARPARRGKVRGRKGLRLVGTQCTQCDR